MNRRSPAPRRLTGAHAFFLGALTALLALAPAIPVSYTHLTLPTSARV